MKIDHFAGIDLHLFDGGAAGGEGAGESGATGETQAGPVSTRRGKSGESKTVLYGKQAAAPADGQAQPRQATGQQAGPSDAGKEDQHAGQAEPEVKRPTDLPASERDSITQEERRKAFMALVTGEGEYKSVFDEQVQRIIDRRFRQTKDLEQRISRSQPIMDVLMQRYGIADGDPDKLLAAIESDNTYWSQAAEEAGMSVDQYKQLQKLQRENAALIEAQRARQGREAADRQIQKWYAEAEIARQTYTDFDLNMEARDPRFLALLRSGVPVQHAYEVIHMDDIKAASARQAAAQTEKQVVDGIRAKGARPQENGTAAQSAFTIKDDVSKLSRRDRAEIARRVQRGETIRF